MQPACSRELLDKPLVTERTLELLVSKLLLRTKPPHGTLWPSSLFLSLGNELQKQLNCQWLPNSGFRLSDCQPLQAHRTQPQRSGSEASLCPDAAVTMRRKEDWPPQSSQANGIKEPPPSLHGLYTFLILTFSPKFMTV